MTIQESYDLFIQNNDRYRSWLGLFLKYIQAAGLDPATIDLDQISLQDLYRYLNWLRGAGYSRNSIRTYQSALKCMIDFMQQHRYMDPDRVDLRCYNLIDADNSSRDPLSPDEIDLIDDCFDLARTQDLRDWCILHLMLDMGFNTLQVCRLSVDHVDLDNGLIWSRPIPPELFNNMVLYDIRVSHIRLYHGSFLVNRSGYPLTYDVIKKIFQRLQDLTGVQRLTPTLVQESRRAG